MPPTYYRGCWHVVSRGFLVRYRQGTSSYSRTCSSLTTEFYDPKAFITHAALLGQAFAHCRRFPTAASRRSLGRVSVPVWPIVLSDRLPIAGTVGRYPAVYLIGRGPIPGRGRNPSPSRGVPGISRGFPRLSRAPGQVPTRYSPVRHSSALRREPFRTTCMS